MSSPNYKIKCRPDDFIVTEVPLDPDLSEIDSPTYTYFQLQKIGITTFDAEEEIARFFGVNCVDVEAQGLKDEDGLAYQMISIKKVLSAQDLAAFNQTYPEGDFTLQIRQIYGYGQEPVRPRFLHGNKFKLVIRHLAQQTADLLYLFCQTNRYFSYVNYYDQQRFGLPGGPYNTPKIGQAIVEADWLLAYRQYQQSLARIRRQGIPMPAGASTRRRGIPMPAGGIPTPTDADECKAFFQSLDRRRVFFFVSSYNSWLWNQAASSLLAESTEGQKYFFDHLGPLFVPTNPAFLHYNLCSIDGYAIQGDQLAVTRQQKERALVVTTNVYPLELGHDELHPEKWQVTLAFYNPTGCYATMLIKQLIFRIKLA